MNARNRHGTGRPKGFLSFLLMYLPFSHIKENTT
jgi:hypothetical protein